jgi:hypothetical protein
VRGISERNSKRLAEARPIRQGLLERHRDAGCWICGHGPKNPWRDKPADCSRLCVHEVACGANRQKALDQLYAVLVLCWFCNGHVVTNKGDWPEARQLAVLRRSAPENYDLVAYNALVNPRAPHRITPAEVDSFFYSTEACGD